MKNRNTTSELYYQRYTGDFDKIPTPRDAAILLTYGRIVLLRCDKKIEDKNKILTS